MASPGTEKRRLDNSSCFQMFDTFGTNSSAALRNVQSEQISLAGGTSPTFGALIPPTGVRIAVLGVGVSFANAVAANASVRFLMSRAGSPLLGSSDDAAGAYNAVLPPAWILAGQGPLSVPQLGPGEATLVTREGDGSNRLWQIVNTLGVGNTAVVTVLYWPFAASDITVC